MKKGQKKDKDLKISISRLKKDNIKGLIKRRIVINCIIFQPKKIPILIIVNSIKIVILYKKPTSII